MSIPRNKRTESQFTANLNSNSSFPSYLGSYKRAFDALLENVYQSKSHVDHLVYPILFMARHCMELGFKANIQYFSKYSEKIDYVTAGTHNLENLFNAFKMHVEETFIKLKENHGIVVEKDDKKLFKVLCKKIESLNIKFHDLDKGSDAFRYPVNKNQNPSITKNITLNILDVAGLLEECMTLFIHTADLFSKYTDYADEIESYYERLMNENYNY